MASRTSAIASAQVLWASLTSKALYCGNCACKASATRRSTPARWATPASFQARLAFMARATAVLMWLRSNSGTEGTSHAASALCSFDRSRGAVTSSPSLLARDGPNNSAGIGSVASWPRCRGELKSSCMPSDSSANWCTNEVLAPFSSRRRTRYASRSRCWPTGA